MVAALQTHNIIGLAMDSASAREKVNSIKWHIEQADYHLNSVRGQLWELRERGGWKALGYKSWRQCVLSEFEGSAANIYRQLDAALVELDLSPNGRQIGALNERVLRPLAKRKFNAEARQAIWAISNEIVGAGGKVTSGVVESVVEGLEEMLRSGTTQDGEGAQHPITERMHADLVARVREKKIAHKEHIRRMNTPRNYIVGGREIQNITRVSSGERGKVMFYVELENRAEIEKLSEAVRKGQPIYCSLWTE